MVEVATRGDDALYFWLCRSVFVVVLKMMFCVLGFVCFEQKLWNATCDRVFLVDYELYSMVSTVESGINRINGHGFFCIVVRCLLF